MVGKFNEEIEHFQSQVQCHFQDLTTSSYQLKNPCFPNFPVYIYMIKIHYFAHSLL